MAKALTSVRTVVINLKESGILTSKPRFGAPSKQIHREARSVLFLVKANARITLSKVALNV